MRVAVIGPALPFKGGGAYPAQLFPGGPRLAGVAEGDAFRDTRRTLAWRRRRSRAG